MKGFETKSYLIKSLNMAIISTRKDMPSDIPSFEEIYIDSADYDLGLFRSSVKNGRKYAVKAWNGWNGNLKENS